MDDTADDCLEPVQVRVGRPSISVYRWRDRDHWTNDGRMPLLHRLLPYARQLRNAYATANRGSERAAECGEQLRSQIEHMLSAATMRDQALVWENEDGLAQAMEQSEYAHFLMSVAAAFHRHHRLELARRYAQTALRVGAALDLPVGVQSGGVRSTSTDCGDGSGRLCFWFHSRGLGVSTPRTEAHTVLNQHLHAIRDSLNLYRLIRESTFLFATTGGEQVANRILLRATGGLNQLAFSVGNTIGDHRPPNIMQLMRRFEAATADENAPRHFYWSAYEYDIQAGVPHDISIERTCHYHTHTLHLLATIAQWLASPPAMIPDSSRQELERAMNHLLQGAGEAIGDARSVHAVYQFYRSEIDPELKRARGCPQPASSPRDGPLAVLQARFGP